MKAVSRSLAPVISVFGVVFSCGLFGAALVFLDWLKPFVPWGAVQDFRFVSLAIVPVGILGINGLVLVVEALNVGWERSALKRVLFLETPTARNDVFYLILRLSGLNYLFSFVLSFGLVFVLARQLGGWLNFDLLASVGSLPLQFVAIVFVNTFVFYWAHRLMHTTALFEIHKVHHSALELNVLTPTRNHPVDFMIMIVINTVPASVLGASPLVVSAYLVLNGLYQCAAHSEITWFERRWIRALVITPRAHRVHHSRLERHYDMNFGVLTLWDRLFGTYCSPVGEGEFPMGVRDEEHFNTDRPVRELVGVLLRWLRGLGGVRTGRRGTSVASKVSPAPGEIER